MSGPGNYAPASIDAESLLLRPVWSILAKGFTGSGKSIFSCGKEFRPIYVFDFEGRIDSVLRYYKKLDGNVKDIHTNHYPFTETGSFFKMDQKMDWIVGQPVSPYKTILASSLTSFIRMVLVHLQKTSLERTGSDGKPKGVRKKGGIQVNILEDFNFEDSAIINDLIGFFQLLKSQGVNTILEAHITPYEIKAINEDSGEKDVTTIMEILTKGKKAPAEIPSWFNEVWLFEKRTQGGWEDRSAQFWVNTVGNQTTSCKSSFGIPSFDWTGKDGSEIAAKFLDPEIANNPRVDPNAPKVVTW